MKKGIQTLLVFFLSISLLQAQNTTTNYNGALADSLGADEYGMRMYVMAILKTGPSKETNRTIIDSAFSGHMSNMGVLAKAGKLIVAGPFSKNELGYRGIFILNATTIKEAKKMVSTDPAIKAGLLDADLIPWYGSAALPKYMDFHRQIEKTSVM